ncbi:spermine synthase [[Candida] railenensis]|uniref:Spermine synthase n=1 Tax=[Candida] railenensis TaxID=45579 RepID=A0A9P0QP58_9ASCO|nr:spermine synthase [[Candida] railenensis]
MIDLATFEHPAVTTINGKHWFHELSEEAFPGQAFSLEIEEVLYHTKSAFQDILIFKSSKFGNILVLNGIIQCTERDEFAYQELITHLPMFSHKAPKRVLVIGGGDCGVVRELIKHSNVVDNITMVEIDDMVIQLSIKYLPQMAKFHNHEKVKIVIDDGFKFLSNLSQVDESEKYDVIITDSSDPEGPAEEFFQVNYFKLLSNSLRKNGIVIMQSSENIWLNLDYVSDLKHKAQKVFPNVEYSQCYMPSYTSGQLGLLIATHDVENNLKVPTRDITEENEITDKFKYYSEKVHEASFVLPKWADSQINK